MRTRHRSVWVVAVVLGLAAVAPAQELSLSVGAGSFFPTENAYDRIYGSSLSIAGDIWFTLKSHIGFAAGIARITDEGVAVPPAGGLETYPVEFRRISVPLTIFYRLDAGRMAIRLGAGAGIHSYRETWQTVDLEFHGDKVSARFVLAVSAALFDRISLFASASYDSIRTGAGSALDTDIDLGGFQLLGGLDVRIFRE